LKILFLKLKNVIGIKSGLGLYEIEIDFSKTKKKVILLLGKNGSGKSTIISCLHPYAEAFNNKKNFIIKGKEGYKEIHIADNSDNIYKIVHHYGKRSNKSFIMKNDVELNINGGIRTFEDIVEKELGITKDFFKLIKLGATTNNFVDLNSSARKQFIGNFMPNIEEYLKAYAIINKKILSQNKDIKFITDELNKLGNLEELTATASSINNRITNVDNLLIELKVKYKQLEQNFDKVTKNEKDYIAQIKAFEALELKLNELFVEENTLFNKYPNSFNGKSLKELEKYETEVTAQIQKYLDEIKDLNHLKETKNIELSNVNLEINKITKKISSMVGPNVDKTKVTNSIATLKVNIDKYKEFFNSCNKEFVAISKFIQPNIETLRTFLFRILELKNTTLQMDEEFNHKELKNLSQMQLDLVEVGTKLRTREIKRDSIRDEIIKNEATKSVVSLCSNTGCKVFNMKEKFNNLDSQFDTLKEEIAVLKEDYRARETIIENLGIMSRLVDPLTKIIAKIPKEIITYIFGKTSDVIESILHTSMETIDNTLNLEKFKFYFEYVSLLQNDTDRLSELEKSLELYLITDKQYTDLKKEKELLLPRKITLEGEITQLEETITSKELIVPKGRTKLTTLRSLITVCKDIVTTKNIIHVDRDDVEKYRQSLLDVTTFKETLSTDKLQIETFENENKNSKKELDRVNIEILRLSEFNSRLENINLKRKKYIVIKESLDIKTGIPLILLGSYMENIKHITNDLLSIAFKNNFLIDFNVTDTEFNIPVIKDNDVTEDINECSDGQIALCKTSLSLGIIIEAISKSPKKYNVVYLDEVDSTLDVENKLAFLSILDRQLKLLDSEQCFVITHNDNFSQADVGLILLRNANVNTDDKDFMCNKEIIHDFR
jgi:Fe-S cluster assembly ATPase SufC